MIRKWSYLTTTHDQNISTSLVAMSKCYSFKVFRMTTRFKKYKRYETSFVRKQDSTRKRQTSWLTLLSIFSQWSLQYIQYRQLLRYHQNTSLYSYQFIVPNISVITKKINLFSPQLSFVTSTLTSQWAKNTVGTNPVNFNTLSTNTCNDNVLSEVNVSGVILEKQTFSQTTLVQDYAVNSLYTNLSQISMTQSNFCYRILILLSLHNIK